MPEGAVRVIAPIDDRPAERAGLRSRDLIIAIDGKPLVAGDGDASAPLRGKAGTKVMVRVVREGTPKPFDVTLVRETIRSTSVRSRMLEPGFGYVRISSFQADTASDFNKAVDGLQKDAPLRGLVLDLRSNPGGLLVGAVQIADELLDKGGIVSTKGRERDRQQPLRRDAGRPAQGRARGGAGRCRVRQRVRSAGRRVARQQARAGGGQPHLRQGFGADGAAAGQRRFGEDHHGALLHAERAFDPGAGHRAGRGPASGGWRPPPGADQRGGAAPPPGGRGEADGGRQCRRSAARPEADRCRPAGAEEAGGRGGSGRRQAGGEAGSRGQAKAQ